MIEKISEVSDKQTKDLEWFEKRIQKSICRFKPKPKHQRVYFPLVKTHTTQKQEERTSSQKENCL